MELPTLEKVSENYHKWENYKNNLETLLKEALPLENKRFYTGILQRLFMEHIHPIYPEEEFDPSFVKGSSSGENTNYRDDTWYYKNAKVEISYYGRHTSRYDDFDYFVDTMVCYDNKVIYSGK